jgi:hypothetical protein
LYIPIIYIHHQGGLGNYPKEEQQEDPHKAVKKVKRVPSKKPQGHLGNYPHGYPYGWGLGAEPHMKFEDDKPEEEDPHKAVKQVKRRVAVTSKKRRKFFFFQPKKEEEEPALQHPYCGVEHIEEAEDMMDHSLE